MFINAKLKSIAEKVVDEEPIYGIAVGTPAYNAIHEVLKSQNDDFTAFDVIGRIFEAWAAYLAKNYERLYPTNKKLNGWIKSCSKWGASYDTTVRSRENKTKLPAWTGESYEKLLEITNALDTQREADAQLQNTKSYYGTNANAKAILAGNALTGLGAIEYRI